MSDEQKKVTEPGTAEAPDRAPELNPEAAEEPSKALESKPETTGTPNQAPERNPEMAEEPGKALESKPEATGVSSKTPEVNWEQLKHQERPPNQSRRPPGHRAKRLNRERSWPRLRIRKRRGNRTGNPGRRILMRRTYPEQRILRRGRTGARNRRISGEADSGRRFRAIMEERREVPQSTVIHSGKALSRE